MDTSTTTPALPLTEDELAELKALDLLVPAQEEYIADITSALSDYYVQEEEITNEMDARTTQISDAVDTAANAAVEQIQAENLDDARTVISAA